MEHECNWIQEDDYWVGECGLSWVCYEGTPAENGMNYCPRCGKNLVEDRLGKAKEKLCAAMSDLSEEIWCAGWLMECEHVFWNWVTENKKVLSGFADEVAELRELSKKVDGWFYWVSDHGKTAGDAPFFINTADWIKRHEKWQQSRKRRPIPFEENGFSTHSN